MYLLDTNTCIQFMNGTSQAVKRHFQQCSPGEIAVCSVVKAELLFGARHSQRVEANLQKLTLFFAPLASLPFDDRCAAEYAQIRADLTRQGKLIGPNDLLIAAIARTHDAVLVTNNTHEFERVTNLRLTDWQAAI
ncbi:MAG: type II toxin-antitoxin system VapC family toxin [Candidatus Thiothrix sulfatifontis]|nr:MAG: type II toxin-antitoxin system VapC family toxin [Candidatus Thiothrix sulfatifontis]